MRTSAPVRAETSSSPLPPPGHRLSWPLIAVLVVQAAFSLSLVWSNTAFGDEADYLLQGRLEWAHWLHGIPIPPFKDSGAPQIYPPIGALANAIGGLAGARILSLCFMLAATVLLYLVTRKIFGFRAAIMSSALWALSEPVLRLAFATYDPLACLLVALSAWLAVQAGVRRRHAELVAASAWVLALASITAFSFAIMIPVVAGVSFLVWREQVGLRLALWFTSWLTGATGFFVVTAMTLLHLWGSGLGSTVGRVNGLGTGISAVATCAWSWDGLIFAVAIAGVVLAFATENSQNRKLLALSLAVSGLIVPLYQAYIGTSWSMDKHMSACSWYLAIAAGYTFSRVTLKPTAATLAAVGALSYPAITGLWYARATFHLWPNESALIREVRPVLGDGSLLTYSDGNTIPEYYLLRQPSDWPRWNTSSPRLGIARTSYSYVALQFNATLNSSILPEKAAYRSGRSLVNLVLQLAAGSGQFALVQELDHSSRYRIWHVLPYTTSNPSAATGLFVIWKAT